MDYISEAKRVFDMEIEALVKTRDSIDSSFEQFVEAFDSCKGKVITVGLGKSGHVARKIAATLSSLGTPSFFLSPADALHGDLGMVSKDDVMLLISYSGEAEEILAMLPIIKQLGAKITAITGVADSTLARNAEVVEVLPPFDEACHMNLAPTSSTTVVQCFGDAIAVAISRKKNFMKEDFVRFHPSGTLGKK